MKRYRFDQSGSIDTVPDGKFVLFDDHAAEVHALNNELTALKLERDALAKRVEFAADGLAVVERRRDDLRIERDALKRQLTALAFLHYGARPEQDFPLPHGERRE